MKPLTLSMRSLLRSAIYRTTDGCWQVPRVDGSGPGRAMAALKARGLITWHHAHGACWILTRQGEDARARLVAQCGALSLLGW